MILGYRQLNKAINSAYSSDKIVSYYQLMNIYDLLARLGNCKIFLSLDIYSGYHHIGLKPEAQPKTAFGTTSGNGNRRKHLLAIVPYPDYSHTLYQKV